MYNFFVNYLYAIFFLKMTLGTQLFNTKVELSKYSFIETKNHTASFNYIEPIIKSVDFWVNVKNEEWLKEFFFFHIRDKVFAVARYLYVTLETDMGLLM